MTRRGGQIRLAHALIGFVVLGAVVTALVQVLDVLLPPQDPAAVRLARDLAAESAGQALPESRPGVPRCPAPGLVPRDPSSTLLYECPDRYDGLVVTYTGEVVGEILQRGDRAWVQLNDDAYALSLGPLDSHGVVAGANSGIGVSLPIEAARRIEHVGGKNEQGDVVTVRGVFRAADPADQGLATIRALRVLDIEPGGHREPQAHPGRRLAALVMLPPTLLVAVLAFRDRLATVLPFLARRRHDDDTG